jgi:pyrroline-5-carboxylate reductase
MILFCLLFQNCYITNALQMGNYEKTVGEVATKGGATEQGIEHFKKNNIDEIINVAIEKAYNRARD